MSPYWTGPVGLDAAQWWMLFFHFAMLSLLAIGGAITTAPGMHRFVVGQQAWLSDAQFTASIALAQAAPGPNVLFVAVIGWNIGGLAGVAATLLGTLLPSTTLTLGISRFSERNRNSRGLQVFSAGMAPITVGLLLATSWLLLEPAVTAAAVSGGTLWLTALLLAATLAMMLGTRCSPLWPVALGAVAGALGWLG